MKNQKNKDLNDRLSGSAAARQAIAESREARRAERERAKTEEMEQARIAEETRLAETAALARADADAREAAENDRIARVISDEAERKAERDRRYAARKARQG